MPKIVKKTKITNIASGRDAKIKKQKQKQKQKQSQKVIVNIGQDKISRRRRPSRPSQPRQPPPPPPTIFPTPLYIQQPYQPPPPPPTERPTEIPELPERPRQIIPEPSQTPLINIPSATTTTSVNVGEIIGGLGTAIPAIAETYRRYRESKAQEEEKKRERERPQMSYIPAYEDMVKREAERLRGAEEAKARREREAKQMEAEAKKTDLEAHRKRMAEVEQKKSLFQKGAEKLAEAMRKIGMRKQAEAVGALKENVAEQKRQEGIRADIAGMKKAVEAKEGVISQLKQREMEQKAQQEREKVERAKMKVADLSRMIETGKLREVSMAESALNVRPPIPPRTERLVEAETKTGGRFTEEGKRTEESRGQRGAQRKTAEGVSQPSPQQAEKDSRRYYNVRKLIEESKNPATRARYNQELIALEAKYPTLGGKKGRYSSTSSSQSSQE